ncbi:tetratricopeptide repeat protein [Corallincola luteus]|uniref:Tetratricopeptide repeat protein n=1 Tax=Corallincola luteus TaxID=1775177 RepID=A0ABY2AJK1_9GAMM|nr:tetratricopeptide repeat protein [Corallincola luteus]
MFSLWRYLVLFSTWLVAKHRCCWDKPVELSKNLDRENLKLTVQFDIKAVTARSLELSSKLQKRFVTAQTLLHLDKWAWDAAQRTAYYDSMDARLAAFHEYLYQELKFRPQAENCLSPDNGLVDRVIEQSAGSPIVMSMLYLYLLQYSEIPCAIVEYPGAVLVRIDDQQLGYRYIDATDGRELRFAEMEARLRGIRGDLARLSDDMLQPIDEDQALSRLLLGLKAALIREERFAEALICCEQLLTLNQDDPFEVRDRGFLLQQLQCFPLALKDFEFFLQKCPDDPSAPLLKTQMRQMASEQVVFH